MRISVIIPVYNAKKYIDRCIGSVIAQSYTNLEIICVDDGATDGTGQILDAYAAKDSRVKVIHEDNQGESHARNEGLKAATGEVIAFCDCDDYIEPDMYETLMRRMEEDNLDISCGGWLTVAPDGKETIEMNKSDVSEGVFGRDELLGYLYKRDSYRGFAYMWNKLYRREVLTDEDGGLLLFDENIRLGGDVIYLGKAALNARRAAYVNRPFYHYVRHKDSGSYSLDLGALADWVKSYDVIIKAFRERNVPKDVIVYVQRFLAYRLSNLAEEAIRQNDVSLAKTTIARMQRLEELYERLNAEHPDRGQRYREIINQGAEL